jgi:acetyl esterase
MPLDPQFRTVLDTFESKGLTPLTRGDAAETRAHYRTLALSRRGPDYVPEQVASAQDQYSPGGVPVRVYEPLKPPGTGTGSTLMYLHGGGWVVGDLDTHDPLCRRVANATGARVVSVDYRLAPEHPFPAALDDAEEVLHWLRAADPGRPLGVAGDSAGASLTAGVALRARDKQLPLAAQLMFYPATDPAMTSPSVAQNGAGYFLTGRDMSWFYEQYLPGGTAATPTTATPTPTASPPAAPTATGPTASAAEADLARADLAGVAPAIVATAEFDPLRDEGAAYAARLADAGVPTQYVPGPGLIHGFAGFLGVVDAADAAVADVLARLRQLLHG